MSRSAPSVQGGSSTRRPIGCRAIEASVAEPAYANQRPPASRQRAGCTRQARSPDCKRGIGARRLCSIFPNATHAAHTTHTGNSPSRDPDNGRRH